LKVGSTFGSVIVVIDDDRSIGGCPKHNLESFVTKCMTEEQRSLRLTM
jgi:hypothetical protein